MSGAANSVTPAQRQIIEAQLQQGLTDLELQVSDEQTRKLLSFLELLVRWNQAFNLTAVRDPVEMVSKHLLDSLSIFPFVFGDSLLDIGTGAGLPGIPLAIMGPERRHWLLDGNGKKVRFVRQAMLELGLDNLEPVQARIETYRPGRKFSTIVSRAVAEDEILSAPCADWLAQPGRLLLMKGRSPDDPAQNSALASATCTLHRLSVPFLDVQRHLIEIRSD